MEKITDKFMQIQFLAIACEQVDVHCFVSYRPHTRQFDVKLYPGKWSKEIDEQLHDGIQEWVIYETHANRHELADEVIEKLEAILYKRSDDFFTPKDEENEL